MATYKTIVVTLPKNNMQNTKLYQNSASRIIKVSKSHNTLPIKLTTNSIVKPDGLSFMKNEPYASVINEDKIVPDKPVRKRQKLDHLSLEQKIMRRKLKNRVAAQTARDRKKTYMDDMERKISKLSSELRTAKAFIIRLQEENSKLHRNNKNLTEQLKDCKCSDIKQIFSSNNSKSDIKNKIDYSQNNETEDDCMVIAEDSFSSIKTTPAGVSVPVSPECLESSAEIAFRGGSHILDTNFGSHVLPPRTKIAPIRPVPQKASVKTAPLRQSRIIPFQSPQSKTNRTKSIFSCGEKIELPAQNRTTSIIVHNRQAEAEENTIMTAAQAVEQPTQPPPLVSDVPPPLVLVPPEPQEAVQPPPLVNDIPSFESLIKNEEYSNEPLVNEKDPELDRILAEISSAFPDEKYEVMTPVSRLSTELPENYSSENCIFSPDMIETIENFEDNDSCNLSKPLLSAASDFEPTRSKIVTMPSVTGPSSPETSDVGYESGNSPISEHFNGHEVPSAFCHAFDLFPQLK